MLNPRPSLDRIDGSALALALCGSLSALLPFATHALAQERSPKASVHWVATDEVPNDLIVGLVVDAETGKPIEGATVRLEGTQIGALTDSVGRFRFDAQAAGAEDLVVVFEWIGYDGLRETVTRSPGAGVAMQASLKEAERVVCGQVYCTGYGCDGGVRLIVTSLLGRLPAGTPVTLVASSGSVADTTVLEVEIGTRFTSLPGKTSPSMARLWRLSQLPDSVLGRQATSGFTRARAPRRRPALGFVFGCCRQAPTTRSLTSASS